MQTRKRRKKKRWLGHVTSCAPSCPQRVGNSSQTTISLNLHLHLHHESFSTMAGPSRIPPFQLLPAEVRSLIWVASLEPRIIPLSCELYGYKARSGDLSNVLYRDRVVHSFNLLSFDYLGIPKKPWYKAHIYPYPVQSPVALSICRESRGVAVLSGYRVWKFESPLLGFRDVMWNPEIDTILFERHFLTRDAAMFDIFVDQCTEQMLEVQKMAVRSSLWGWRSQSKITPLFPLLHFSALKEFVVVVEEQHEKCCSEWTAGVQRATLAPGERSWTLPQDLQKSLKEVKVELMLAAVDAVYTRVEKWTPPAVRIVRSEEDLLRGGSEEMKLRCHPDDL
ncbi:hypothetical protein BDZ45DRAFT_410486 [Acephala macrosclerotiorum]|nr:hypothetical protein BDZ45DRAFT_410486 [Acephala macrosclerotiorum]